MGDSMEKLIVGQWLEHKINEYIQQMPSDASISYVVLRLSDEAETSIIASAKENAVYTGASLESLVILEYVFHLAKEGQLDLHDTVSLQRSPRVGGRGALQELLGVRSFSYLELCRFMIIFGDNWATNLLITTLGMEYINARAEQLGLSSFTLHRYMMDDSRTFVAEDNEISAIDMALLLDQIYRLRDTVEGREMWTILGRHQYNDILSFHWGGDTTFHHMTGSATDVVSDVGLIETMNGDFAFVFMAQHMQPDEAKQLGARIGVLMKEFVEEALP